MQKKIISLNILIIIFVLNIQLRSQPINYWENFKINTSQALSSGACPVITNLADGKLLICWKKWKIPNEIIVGRIYDSELQPITSELTFLSASYISRKGLFLIGLLNGDFAILWQTGPDPIKVKIFNSKGEYKDISIDIMNPNIPPGITARYHSAAVLKNGNFVVCWHLGPSAGIPLSEDKSMGIYIVKFLIKIVIKLQMK